MSQKTKLLLGGHMSIAGGLYKAVLAGESIGCTVIQIFTRSNRQWKAKPLEKSAVQKFKETFATSTVQKVVVHLPYLLNIGSPNSKIRHASLSILKDELKRCHILGVPFAVLHPGSYLAGSQQECLERIIKGINTVLSSVESKTMLLLENMAGQGTNVGYSFEQIEQILNGIEQKKRVGICFDTCHAFAAGYDFHDKEMYAQMWKDFDKSVGLKKLKVLHINDSKRRPGSHVDRHEDIGKGKIGLEGFKLLMNDERFFSVPKILETPKPTLQKYAKNMDILKGLLSARSRRLLQL